MSKIKNLVFLLVILAMVGACASPSSDETTVAESVGVANATPEVTPPPAQAPELVPDVIKLTSTSEATIWLNPEDGEPNILGNDTLNGAVFVSFDLDENADNNNCGTERMGNGAILYRPSAHVKDGASCDGTYVVRGADDILYYATVTFNFELPAPAGDTEGNDTVVATAPAVNNMAVAQRPSDTTQPSNMPADYDGFWWQYTNGSCPDNTPAHVDGDIWVSEKDGATNQCVHDPVHGWTYQTWDLVPGQGGGATTALQSSPANPGVVVLGDGNITWAEFYEASRGFDGNPHEEAGPFYAMLDTYFSDVKISHDESGWTLTAPSDEVCAYWGGVYGENIDSTFGGKSFPWIVDADGSIEVTDPRYGTGEGTGTWILTPGQSIVVPTSGAQLKCMKGWDGTTTPPAGQKMSFAQTFIAEGQGGGETIIQAQSCVANGEVVGIIQLMHQNDTSFIALNTVANVNLPAQLRSEFNSTVQPMSHQTFIWTLTGSASGDLVTLAEHNGKSLYLAVSNNVITTTHPFNGIQVCAQVQASDFDWVNVGNASIAVAPQPTPTPETPMIAQVGGGSINSGAVPTENVVSIINANKGSAGLYDQLLTFVGSYPDSVSTDTNGGTITVLNTGSLIVTRDGNIVDGALLLDSMNVNGTIWALWLATVDGNITISGEYTAFNVTTNINPEQHFPWWA